MVDFETYQGRSEPFSPIYIPVSGINTEWIGIPTDEAMRAIRETRTLKDAQDFVSSYVQGVAGHISDEFADSTEALAKRHLIDLLYVSRPTNHKADHPSHRSSYLIVEAMIDLLPPDENYIDYMLEPDEGLPPQDVAYREIANKIRQKRVSEKRAKTLIA